MYTKEQESKIQEAIVFLSDNFTRTGHNTKPVILHSIRVALYLYNLNVSAEVVIASLLHDLLEDTDVTVEMIREVFGNDVASLVEANTFKSEIADYMEKTIETFKRNLAHGSDAALIKGSDLLDNANYYHLADEEMKKKLFAKFSLFVEMSQPVIGETQVWRDLKRKEEAFAIQ